MISFFKNSKKGNKSENTNTEENFENEFFSEDTPKNAMIKALIGAGVLFVLLIILIIFMLVNKNSGNSGDDTSKLNETIIDYSAEDTGLNKKDDNSTDISKDDLVNDMVIENGENDVSTSIIERSEDEPAKLEPIVSSEPVPTPTPAKEAMELDVKDFSKVKYDAKSNLREIEYYFDQNNWDAVTELAHLDRFLAMSYALRNTKEFSYYGDVNADGQPNGKGVAVYADNQYYFGEWVNGVRQGNGTWIHYHIHLKKDNDDMYTYHQFVGEFKNDLPNGNGQDHYEYNHDMLKDSTWYITNYMGTYKDGLIDGEIYCTATTSDDRYCDFLGTAHGGSFEKVVDTVDKNKKSPVLYSREDEENYIWMDQKENLNLGVSSYISKNK